MTAKDTFLAIMRFWRAEKGWTDWGRESTVEMAGRNLICRWPNRTHVDFSFDLGHARYTLMRRMPHDGKPMIGHSGWVYSWDVVPEDTDMVEIALLIR